MYPFVCFYIFYIFGLLCLSHSYLFCYILDRKKCLYVYNIYDARDDKINFIALFGQPLNKLDFHKQREKNKKQVKEMNSCSNHTITPFEFSLRASTPKNNI